MDEYARDIKPGFAAHFRAQGLVPHCARPCLKTASVPSILTLATALPDIHRPLSSATLGLSGVFLACVSDLDPE